MNYKPKHAQQTQAGVALLNAKGEGGEDGRDLLIRRIAEEDHGEQIPLASAVLGASIDAGLEAVKQRTAQRVAAAIRSGSFDKMIDGLIHQKAEDLAVDALGERLAEIDERIRRKIHENWDEQVEKAAHAILQQKLAEMRKRFA